MQPRETRTLRILPAGESDATMSFFESNRVSLSARDNENAISFSIEPWAGTT
jgi:hypothetical protein